MELKRITVLAQLTLSMSDEDYEEFTDKSDKDLAQLMLNAIMEDEPDLEQARVFHVIIGTSDL